MEQSPQEERATTDQHRGIGGRATDNPSRYAQQMRSDVSAQRKKHERSYPISLRYIVVRDKKELDQGGGTYVSDLERAKRFLMKTTTGTDWTLVLSIHGSQERLAAQWKSAPKRDVRYYSAPDIIGLFEKDPNYVRWRDHYGPTRLVLNSCQVTSEFERVIINSITRAGTAGARQTAQGLGTGCTPDTFTVTFRGVDNRTVANRRGFERQPASVQQYIELQAQELNAKWGYFGAPPVPNDEVLHYLLDTVPIAGWPKVQVAVKVVDPKTKKEKKQPTGIPFWNRRSVPYLADFERLCREASGRLKQRVSGAPP
jgi:hypothetical protein